MQIHQGEKRSDVPGSREGVSAFCIYFCLFLFPRTLEKWISGGWKQTLNSCPFKALLRAAPLLFTLYSQHEPQKMQTTMLFQESESEACNHSSIQCCLNTHVNANTPRLRSNCRHRRRKSDFYLLLYNLDCLFMTVWIVQITWNLIWGQIWFKIWPLSYVALNQIHILIFQRALGPKKNVWVYSNLMSLSCLN